MEKSKRKPYKHFIPSDDKIYTDTLCVILRYIRPDYSAREVKLVDFIDYVKCNIDPNITLDWFQKYVSREVKFDQIYKNALK